MSETVAVDVVLGREGWPLKFDAKSQVIYKSNFDKIWVCVQHKHDITES